MWCATPTNPVALLLYQAESDDKQIRKVGRFRTGKLVIPPGSPKLDRAVELGTRGHRSSTCWRLDAGLASLLRAGRYAELA